MYTVAHKSSRSSVSYFKLAYKIMKGAVVQSVF